jgi:hypothetical protein
LESNEETPEVDRYLAAEEKVPVQAFEATDAPLKSRLRSRAKREIKSMTHRDERCAGQDIIAVRN